jgi:hypothetical protein
MVRGRAAKKVESVGPGGCACLCKACDDQRHCHRPEKGCRANEQQEHLRKRKGTKKAIGRVGVRKRLHGKKQSSSHPKECDYPRYRATVNEDSAIYQTFQRTAKLLGEVEAGLDAFYRLARHHGLLAAPPDGKATICTQHATQISEDVGSLQALLSTEAKLLMPIIFMLTGDKHAAKVMGVEVEEPTEETIH